MIKISTSSGQEMSFVKSINKITSNGTSDIDDNQLILLMKKQKFTKKHFLFLPYKGKIVDDIVTSMKRSVQKLLLKTFCTQI